MFAQVTPHLDERQRRILAGSVARALGRGGIVAVAEATGMSRSTLQAAVAQVDAGTTGATTLKGQVPAALPTRRASDLQQDL